MGARRLLWLSILAASTGLGCGRRGPGSGAAAREAGGGAEAGHRGDSGGTGEVAGGAREAAVDGAEGEGGGGGSEAGVGSGEAPAEGYLLETVGDYTVLAPAPPDLSRLTVEQRALAYHLYRAAIAGDAITYHQRHPRNPEIKELLETLVQHPREVPVPLLRSLWTYLKLFWINHGVHDAMNGDKTVPGFDAEQLAGAAEAVRAAGFPVLGESRPDGLRERLRGLEPLLFDPAVDPYNVRKAVGPGEDLLAGSSNGFYEGGVRSADLEGFTERYPLNSTLVKGEGGLREEVWRAGGEGVEAGRYAVELRSVVRHLEAAMRYAEEGQRRGLELLVRYFRTGDPEAFREYNIAWVSDRPPVDAILGFIEVYLDPRGRKGAWEGLVFVPDGERSGRLAALAENAGYFEARLPYAEAYRRTEFSPPVASVVNGLALTGDGGPVSPAGVNLPNAQELRERYGSKSIVIANLTDAVEAVTGEMALGEFAWDAEERALGRRCLPYVQPLSVAFHEVIGHGSGKQAATLAGDPAEHLPGVYGTLEEARAELVALHLAFDPRTVELGFLPDADCAVEVVRAYLRGGLLMLRRLPPGGRIEEDHWRATMLIVRWAIDRGAVAVEQREGKFFLRLADLEGWRAAVGELLGEVMRIKAEGDLAAGRALVETYAVAYDPAWWEDVDRRVRAIGYPRKYAFVAPILRETRDGNLDILDVRAERPRSLVEAAFAWNALAAEDRSWR